MNVYTVIRAEHPRCIHCGAKMESWFFNQDESTMECDACLHKQMAARIAVCVDQALRPLQLLVKRNGHSD